MYFNAAQHSGGTVYFPWPGIIGVFSNQYSVESDKQSSAKREPV